MPPRKRLPRQVRTARNQRRAQERTALEQAGLRPLPRARRAVADAPAISHAVSAASQETARAEANREMSYETALALQEAKLGDDSILLPYQPTPSINPPRPRTLAAGYDKDTKTLRIRFREGAIYAYNEVTPREWAALRRTVSPGRYINRVLNAKPYYRENWT